jgi:glycosyltransferase involved in cell wall biosynthesis
MRDTYNAFDVLISTTQGEGFGLTAIEAMACRVPCVLPNWAAFSDWASRGAWLVPCPTTAIGMPYVNVIGGIPDESHMVRALQKLYIDKNAREQNAQAAFECASQVRYRWDHIGERWLDALSDLLGTDIPDESNVASTTV